MIHFLLKHTAVLAVKWSRERLLLPTESREQDSAAAFVTNGFNCWKAIGKFKLHEASQFHRAAVDSTEEYKWISPEICKEI